MSMQWNVGIVIDKKQSLSDTYFVYETVLKSLTLHTLTRMQPDNVIRDGKHSNKLQKQTETVLSPHDMKHTFLFQW